MMTGLKTWTGSLLFYSEVVYRIPSCFSFHSLPIMLLLFFLRWIRPRGGSLGCAFFSASIQSRAFLVLRSLFSLQSPSSFSTDVVFHQSSLSAWIFLNSCWNRARIVYMVWCQKCQNSSSELQTNRLLDSRQLSFDVCIKQVDSSRFCSLLQRQCTIRFVCFSSVRLPWSFVIVFVMFLSLTPMLKLSCFTLCVVRTISSFRHRHPHRHRHRHRRHLFPLSPVFKMPPAPLQLRNLSSSRSPIRSTTTNHGGRFQLLPWLLHLLLLSLSTSSLASCIALLTLLSSSVPDSCLIQCPLHPLVVVSETQCRWGRLVYLYAISASSSLAALPFCTNRFLSFHNLLSVSIVQFLVCFSLDDVSCF